MDPAGTQLVRPPSAIRCVAVMYPARSDNRKTTASAISAGSAMRFIATLAALAASSAAGSSTPSNSARNIGVLVVPGQTAFTRILHDDSSAAALRVIARIAPFVAV